MSNSPVPLYTTDLNAWSEGRKSGYVSCNSPVPLDQQPTGFLCEVCNKYIEGFEGFMYPRMCECGKTCCNQCIRYSQDDSDPDTYCSTCVPSTIECDNEVTVSIDSKLKPT